jgi:hypothetical protein
MEIETLTADEIADHIVTEQQRQRQLEQQAEDVERALGIGNGDTAQLAIQHVTLTAQVKAVAARILDLGSSRHQAEQREALAAYEHCKKDRLAKLAVVDDINAQIKAHQEAIIALQKTRTSPTNTPATELQTARARESKAYQRLLGLGANGNDPAFSEAVRVLQRKYQE